MKAIVVGGGKVGYYLLKTLREKRYDVHYKDIILPHNFFADFIAFGNVILEVKAITGIPEESIAQAINYLKVSGNRLALIVNFGELKLHYKRLVF